MDNVQPMDGLDFLSLAVTAVVSYLVLFLLTKLVGNKQLSLIHISEPTRH